MTPLCLKTYPPLPLNRKEILRYAGARTSTPETDALLASCLDELADGLSYGLCYREFPIALQNGTLDLTFARTDSVDLQKTLDGCDSIILFAATVGHDIDRKIAKYSRLSPAKALLFQSIGAAAIEALCDRFNLDMKEEKAKLQRALTPRFSPGYGDLPLALQKDIFAALDCGRKIGLTLTDSLLISPTKSVTAIIGIKKADSKGLLL